MLKLFLPHRYVLEIVEGPEHVLICKSTSARSRMSAQSRTALTDSSKTVLSCLYDVDFNELLVEVVVCRRAIFVWP